MCIRDSTQAGFLRGNQDALSDLVVLNQIKNELYILLNRGEKGFLKKASETGKYFLECLENLASQHSIIKEVRGKGMILAMELDKPGSQIVVDCMKNGFLINCIKQNILRFLPPLNISKKDISSLMPVLSNSLLRLSKKKN